jgi:hypothetical protein
MKTMITVGTDAGDWAPPKRVELGVTFNAPSGLGITNTEAVSWRLTGHGCIVMAAIAVGPGWARVDLNMGPLAVEDGQELIIAAFAVTIDVGLPRLYINQAQIGGRLRELKR